MVARLKRRLGVLVPAAVLAGIVALTLGAGPAGAEREPLARIAAIVDDTVISDRQVERRLALTQLSAGLSESAGDGDALRQRIVDQLVTETLQKRAAREAGVSLPRGAVDDGFSRLADRNNMSPQAFERALENAGVSAEVLRNQIEANLLWQGYLRQRVQQEVEIDRARIERALADLEAARGEPEVRLREITLVIDADSESEDERTLATDLVAEIRGGADFAPLARQFSDSPSAVEGGNLGWVRLNRLRQEARAAVRDLAPGEVSDPIVGETAVRIYQLADKRRVLTPEPEQITVDLARLRLPDESAAQAGRQEIAGCDGLGELAQENGGTRTRFGEVTLSDLSNDLQRRLTPLQAGEATDPVRADGSWDIYIVCDRAAPEAELPSRDEMRQRLLNQRAEELARGILRDLRRDAHVEIRR